MTRTRIVKAMAERLGVGPRPAQSIFDALAEMATQQTHKAAALPGLGATANASSKLFPAAVRRRFRNDSFCGLLEHMSDFV